MTAVSDMTGKTFGNWTVIERSPKSDSRQNAYWLCRCRCGTEQVIMGGNLRRGFTTSCGCEVDAEALTPLGERGLIGTPEYRAWIQMKRRCYDPRYTDYESWGGRGITVCQEWIDSFDVFLAHVGLRPARGWSLDRIDNDGNYEPTNVRWATGRQQMGNRRPGSRRSRLIAIHLPLDVAAHLDQIVEAADMTTSAWARNLVEREIERLTGSAPPKL